MTIIVTGGRHYDNDRHVYRVLDEVNPETVIEGGASGADALSREWCQDRMRECITRNADWIRHGYAAGPIRNENMAKELIEIEPNEDDRLCIAFPGDRGTKSMIRFARKYGIKIRDERGADENKQ